MSGVIGLTQAHSSFIDIKKEIVARSLMRQRAKNFAKIAPCYVMSNRMSNKLSERCNAMIMAPETVVSLITMLLRHQ